MNENDFKISLGKILERRYINSKPKLTVDFIDVYTALPDCGLYFDYTGLFTRVEWNTYQAILHLKCPLSKLDVLEKYHKIILEEAIALFGKEDDYLLTALSIDPLVERYKIFEFEELGLNETLRRAIGDASTFMAQGKYSSCIDRVHTAIHGYLRIKLDELDVTYEETDMMPKLFNLLYQKWSSLNNSDINEMMLKAIRSASATLDALNNIRNRHSLAHPNTEIIDEQEAKFILGLKEIKTR